MKRSSVLLAGLASFSMLAAPVYEAKDVEVSPEAIRCRPAGTSLLVGEDAFARRDFWKLANYNNRLGIEVGGVRDGVRGLCLDGSAKTCDTAWTATSGKIALKGAGRRYRLGFGIDGRSHRGRFCPVRRTHLSLLTYAQCCHLAGRVCVAKCGAMRSSRPTGAITNCALEKITKKP